MTIKIEQAVERVPQEELEFFIKGKILITNPIKYAKMYGHYNFGIKYFSFCTSSLQVICPWRRASVKSPLSGFQIRDGRT